MKRTQLFLLLLCLPWLSNAQGNLQFNQVINHNLTGTVNMDFGSGNSIYTEFQTLTITIPAGKVWKIESASVNLKPEPPYSNSVYRFDSDNQTILAMNSIELVKELSGYTPQPSIYSPANIKYPFWMPSGTYNLKLSGYYYYNNTYPQGSDVYFRANGFLSAIEYNVVP